MNNKRTNGIQSQKFKEKMMSEIEKATQHMLKIVELLRGLDKRLSTKTDLPVYIAEDPLRAVVRGTGITLKTLNRYKGILIK